MGAFDHHDLARFIHNHADGKRIHLCAGKRFRKNLSLSHFGENISVSVIVNLNYLHRAAKHYADVFCGRAFGKHRIFFIKAYHFCPKAVKHF